MYSILLHVAILTLILRQVATQKRCANSICNFESICILRDGKPTCDCVGNVFEEEFCSVPQNFCHSERCKNGGTCHPYLGHTFCECAAGYSGQECASKKDIFKGFHVHYNRLAPVGEKQTFILMAQSLGSVETIMEFFTSDNIIDGFAFTSSSGHFQESNDLRALSDRLQIRHSDQVPYRRGFYRISHGTFWKLGLDRARLDMSDMDISAELFFYADFTFLVYDPTEVRCIPVMHFPSCAHPRLSLHLDTASFNFIEPVVEKRCAENSRLRIRWTVRNYINTVLLHTFPEHASTVLTIPPYTMWFNYRDDFMQSYLIRADVREVDQNGNQLARTGCRCYVFVTTKPTRTLFLGGPFRDVNPARIVVVDASMSRDYARPPNSDQQLEYRWFCQSEDTDNQYCRRNLPNVGPRFKIPRNGLKLGYTYTFSAEVTSTINIYSYHRDYQVIRTVLEDPLFIYFRCLRNCDQNMFTAGKIINLRIDCLKCPSGNIAYSVVNEQGTEVANTASVIFTETSRNDVTLTANAVLGTRKGTASIRLSLNRPPAGGNCQISPTAGVEYQTEFVISCSGYTDDEQPIQYTYRAGNTTLDQSANSTLCTRLFPSSGQNCEIRVTVCDYMRACVDVNLQATLSPIAPNGSWADLLSQEGTDLNKLIKDGDRPAAMALIQSVIPHMPSDENFEIASHIVESLRNLEPERLLVVEQVLTIGNDLFETLELSSDSAILVTELFSSVSNGLLHSIRNGEVQEMTANTHEQMIGQLAQSMSKATTEVEEFSMVHDAEPIPPEDPFSEDYSDYGDLDMEEVVHISNWLNSFNRMHECLQIMGVASAFIQLPHESSVITKRKGVTSMTVVIDKSESDSLNWNDSTTSVSLPDEFLRSLNGKEIAIQVSIFQENPFWWNPDQYKMSTEVLSVGAYTKDLESLDSSSTNVAFSFFMAIKNSKELGEGNFTNGSVADCLDMEIYERVVPPNAILVVTFTSPDNDLRILLTIGERPRSHMLENAHHVKVSQENSTYFVANDRNKERTSFLAVTSKCQTNFSFAMYTRMCLTWNPKTFEWTSQHCSVGSETNSTHIHCLCSHLSMFGAKVHPTFGDLRAPSHMVQKLPINYGLIAFYLLIIIFLFALILLAWRWDVAAAKGVVWLNSKPGRRAKYKYLVTIYTNGHANAATTANVTIQLHGTLSNSAEYILYSSTSHPLFHRLSQTSFVILSETSLGLLQSALLHHDSFGRYPTWNCHMVKVRDEFDKKEYIFLANKYLSDYESNSCSILIPLAKSEDLHRRPQIFRDTLSDTFANWYAQQSIFPARLYGNLTAVEKTTILIVRLCITLVGIMLFFGPTTLINYEEERETYYSMLLDFGTLLTIAFLCHLVGLIAAILLHYLFLKLRPNQNNPKYTLIFDN